MHVLPLIQVSAESASAVVNTAVVVVSAVMGAISTHVAHKVNAARKDAERERRLDHLTAELEDVNRRLSLTLKSIGRIFSHLGLGDEYSSMLAQLLTNTEQ